MNRDASPGKSSTGRSIVFEEGETRRNFCTKGRKEGKGRLCGTLALRNQKARSDARAEAGGAEKGEGPSGFWGREWKKISKMVAPEKNPSIGRSKAKPWRCRASAMKKKLF